MKFSEAMKEVLKGEFVARKGSHKFVVGIFRNRLIEYKKCTTYLNASPATFTANDIRAEDWKVIVIRGGNGSLSYDWNN